MWITIGYLLIVVFLVIAFLEFYAITHADSSLRAVGRPSTLNWILTTEIEEPHRPLGFSRDGRITKERRRQPRRPISAEARIISESPFFQLRCFVENISTCGAKLAIANNKKLPSTFCLHVPESGIAYLANVIWKSDHKVGVKIMPLATLELPIKSIIRPTELIEQAA